jgi:hypothetical protein
MKEKDKDINNYLMDLAEELEKRIEAKEVEPVYSSELTVMEMAFMLTQYQHGNAPVTFNEFSEWFIDEIMPDPTVADVNAHLEADCRFDDMFYENDPDSFNDILCGAKPWDVAMMLSNQWNPSDDYWYYDGYGHIRSCSKHEIIADYGDETKEYMFEKQDFEFDDDRDGERECIYDDAEIIIEYCNRMLRDGL